LRTETLRVEFAPDRVGVTRTRRGVLRGAAHSYSETPVPPGDLASPVWLGALQALQAALVENPVTKAHASVTLASRLVRYALVPWSDALSGESEERAFARHCFERVYGESAAQWDLRVSAERAGAPRLASAVDAALPDALRETFASAGVRLDSIQPNLMALCNDNRRRLHGRHAWLALLEPGSLFLALLVRGRWTRVRTVRIGAAWRVELARILDREAYLVDPDAVASDVFLCAPGLGEVKLPENDRWQFHPLTQAAAPVMVPPAPTPGLAEG
jgi:hypothetical protein